MSLTITETDLPVAIYKGKPKQNKIIYYKQNDESDSDENDDILEEIDENNMISDSLLKKLRKKYNKHKAERLAKSIDPENKRSNKQYKKEIVEQSKTNFKFKHKNTMFLPGMEKRNVLYVAGPSGAGKSYVCAEYVKIYHEFHPDRPIYLFSKKGDDPAFDQHEFIERMEVNPELLSELDMDDFRETLCIFDDVHTFTGDQLKIINQLQADLMDLGRSYLCDVVITNHLLTDGQKTRQVLNEMSKMVMYPEGSSAHSINYVLKKYIGLTKKEIEKIMRLKTRWIMINRFPRYIVHQKGIYIPGKL